MDNIFIHKHTNEEVSLIHMGKMDKSKETVAIFQVALDRTIMVMHLSEFNHNYEQYEFSKHNCFTKHNS